MLRLTEVLRFAAARAMLVVAIEDLVACRLAWGPIDPNRQSRAGECPANDQLQTFSS